MNALAGVLLHFKSLSLNRNGIRGVDDATVSVEEIVSYFKECSGHLGKPKLFFIQACRNDDDIDDDSTGVGYKKNLCPPDSSDILVAYSTVEGELSYRDRRKGSWFIQTLIKQITTYAKDAHLMDIMIAVNKDIAESGLGGKRQMPQQVCTLTKFVYFKMARDMDSNIEDGVSDAGAPQPRGQRGQLPPLPFTDGGSGGSGGNSALGSKKKFFLFIKL